MTNAVRRDDYCIRFGGEEFVIVGYFENKESIINVAERIRNKVAALIFQHDKGDFRVTLSGGIALHNVGNESLHETINRADEKLYLSKQSGRNQITV